MKTFAMTMKIITAVICLFFMSVSIWIINGGYRVGFGVAMLIFFLICLIIMIKDIFEKI